VARDTVALDVLLQREGFGTRRACRVLVHQGRVEISGAIAEHFDLEVAVEGAPFTVDGESDVSRRRIVVALHKPAGFEVSRKPQHHESVFALLPTRFATRGVQPVGRLDTDTTGLLLFTDDGPLLHALSAPRHGVAKVYVAELQEEGAEVVAARLRRGVQLHDEPEPTVAAAAEALGARSLRITLHEGKYHQVKRMVAAAGNRVVGLHREAVGGLSLGADWPAGVWRFLDDEAVATLRLPTRGA
jgi:16S rRNA pseudouridine516 synthase